MESMDEEGLKKMKVAELKELLQSRGLPMTGKKEELIHRLLTENPNEQPVPQESPKLPKLQSPIQQNPKQSQVEDSSLEQAQIEQVEPNKAHEVTIKSSQSKNALQMTLGMDEVERIKARQARFGTTAPILQELEEARKLEERRQRFASTSN